MYPAFFKELVVLDEQRDASLLVKPMACFDFAADAARVPAVLGELANLVDHYPVLFSLGETPGMVALLGDGENRFLAKDGSWRQGTYIPQVVRSYPFAAVCNEGEELLLCLDRSHPGVGDETGERIFTDCDGTLTSFGLQAATFANDLAINLLRTQAFTGKLKSMGLLVPADAAGEGLAKVHMARLSSLPHEELKELITSGEMYLLYLHHFSLKHLADDVQRRTK